MREEGKAQKAQKAQQREGRRSRGHRTSPFGLVGVWRSAGRRAIG